MSIAIFPASGGLGGATLTKLLDFVDPKDVILVARKPEKLAEKRALGVEIRQADYDDASTLGCAFDGVQVLNLISYQSAEHERRVELHKMAIDAAVVSGVRHIVYSSLAYGGLEQTPSFACQPMLAHVDTEAYLRSLASPDFTITIARIGLYAEGFDLYTASFDLAHPPADGLIRIPHPGTGPGIAWAAKAELGEAVARMLEQIHHADAQTAPYANELLVLSGPEDLSLSATANVFADVLGRSIQIREVSVDEYASLASVQGGSEYGAGEFAVAWASTFEAVRRGLASPVTPWLEQLLSRPPTPFVDVVRHLASP